MMHAPKALRQPNPTSRRSNKAVALFTINGDGTVGRGQSQSNRDG